MRGKRLHTILTKEFLEREHIQNKKSLNKIAKEVGCDYKSVVTYFDDIHRLKRNPPEHGLKNKNHTQWKGYEDISKTYWENVKTGARNRKISVNLTIEQIWNLYIKQNRKCALSGINIGFEASKSNTASLDRIDSTKGYEIDNVQWIHRDINTMKWDLQQEHFIEMCKLIAKHQNENFRKTTSNVG